MMDVFLTCDTEIWCGGWAELDARFPEAFRRCVYGVDSKGSQYALPFQLDVLSRNGLHGVFFVEPLFSLRFGLDRLSEVVKLVISAGHEVQLHIHTEWLDEAPERLLPHIQGKKQYMRHFNEEDQARIIAEGIRLLEAAGAVRPTAFRAGGYGFDGRTLSALQSCGIPFDTSYNPVVLGNSSGVSPGAMLLDVTTVDQMVEFPVSVFRDGAGRLRPAQIGACSSSEIEQALLQAAEAGQSSFVIVFHNFELLNASRSGPDSVVVGRFERLCRFLAANREIFRTRGFHEAAPNSPSSVSSVHAVRLSATARRWLEQAYRRVAA